MLLYLLALWETITVGVFFSNSISNKKKKMGLGFFGNERLFLFSSPPAALLTTCSETAPTPAETDT